MKPNWKDAPEWAKFMAMDRSGQWSWYEESPFAEPYSGCWDIMTPGYRNQVASTPDTENWKESLEQRPE